MSTINSTGYDLDTYDEVKQALEADFKDAFGDDIKVTPDSVFGQIINIFAEVVSDQNEVIEASIAQTNPQSATGVFHKQIVMFNGIEAKESEFSTVSLNCTASTSSGTTIPEKSLVSHVDTGEQFETDIELVVPAGNTLSVSATAVNSGPIEASAGKLTKIDTPIFAWETVTNPSDAILGADEETDPELRVRRQIAASQTGASTVPAIFTAVKNIDAVEFVKVIANNTPNPDQYGVAANSVWTVVSGGADNDIAQALFETVAAGTGYYNTGGPNGVLVNYNDPVTGDTYPIKFERPTAVDIWIIVNLEKDLSLYPADGDDQIKAALVNYFETSQTIGLDVFHSRLFTPVNSIPGHSVTSLLIGTSSPPSAEDDIPIAVNELAQTATAKITVNTVGLL
jgi:uncharacterized phage protein gp47/JayE